MSKKSLTLKGFHPPWKIYDVFIVLFVTIVVPIALSAWLGLLSGLSIIPRSISEFIVADGIIPSTVRIIFSLALEIGMIAYVLKKYGLSLDSFGIRKFKFFKALMYIISFYLLFAICILLVYGLVSILFPSVDINQAQENVFEFGKQGFGLVLSFIVTVMIAPIIEELYFRGFIFPALSNKVGYVLGALMTSLLFGLLHFQLNIIIYTFVLGLFLSFMYYRLRSIIPGILLHILNNLIAFLIVSKII